MRRRRRTTAASWQARAGPSLGENLYSRAMQRLASAPCTWGVWERTVGRDDLVPPDRMLETVRGLGYTGIELGPPGYFGDDPDEVVERLAGYGLELVGAFAPLRIADEDGFRDDLAFLD